MVRSNPVGAPLEPAIRPDETISPVVETLTQSGSSPDNSVLLDAGPPMALIDPERRLIQSNRGFRDLVADASESDGSDRVPPGLISREMIDKALVGQQKIEADQTVVRRLEKASYRICCEPVLEAGGVQHLALSYFNLHRERQAVERAAQIEERFYDIGRLITDWIWEVNAEFGFTLISPRATEILGLPLRLIFGRNLFEFGEFQSSERRGAPTSPTAESRTPFSDALYSVSDINGKPKLFRMSGVPIFDSQTGEFVGYRGTGVDITQQRQTEEALSKNQALLQGIIDNTPTAICLKDLESRYLLVNRQFESYATRPTGIATKTSSGEPPTIFSPRGLPI